jgi:hypothetical protein
VNLYQGLPYEMLAQLSSSFKKIILPRNQATASRATGTGPQQPGLNGQGHSSKDLSNQGLRNQATAARATETVPQ